jgi:pyruvate formate lyase activating enzyme
MEVTDLVMLDIKHIDEKVHQTLTGQTGENIKEMAREMSDMGQPMWIRHVLIPGDNSQDKYLIEMREFIQTLKTVERVEILPYHTLGVFKWEQLGIDYPLKGVNPPTQEEVKHAEELLGI